MGVPLEIYRSRIGLFNVRVKKASTTSCDESQCGLLSLFTPVAALVLLLIISGIEPNPGPGGDFKCRYCHLELSSTSQYCSHVVIHQSRKNFTIPCCFCERHLKNVSSFQCHVSRYHRDQRMMPAPASSLSVKCPVCLSETQSRLEYSKHMCDHLLKGQSFKCNLGCNLTYDDRRKFQKHMSRYHPTSTDTNFTAPSVSVCEATTPSFGDMDSPPDKDEDPDQEVNECNMTSDSVHASIEDNSDGDVTDLYPDYVVKDEVAMFYLSLEGLHSIPTVIVQEVADKIKLFTELSHYKLKLALKEKLVAAGLEESQIKYIISSTFRNDPIFNIHHKGEDLEQLSTHHLRSKYWQSRYPYVEPKEIFFGLNEAGKKRRAHYVPIKETLDILLKDNKVKKMVSESFERPSTEGVLSDYCDGSAYHEHKCQHHDRKCLQILLFQDAYSFNPFGPESNAYKPIGFYYSLGNISQEYRSKVDLIQLVYMILEKDTKPTAEEELDGKDVLKAALQPLLDELLDLKENGVIIDGEKVPVCLMFIIGDSLGQHFIGRYVLSFICEFSCRYCEISVKEFLERPDVAKPLRTPEQYDRAVMIAERKWSERRRKARENLKKAKKRAEKVASRSRAPGKKTLIKTAIPKSTLQKIRAVNFRGVKYHPSPFNSQRLKFHVSSPALPPCLAHDLFEGIIKSVVASVLRYLIQVKKWFDFDTLNRRIRAFKCKGSDKKDAPKPLKSLDKLNGNAVQNWNLLRLLPFIIGDLIQDTEDKVWRVLLALKEITEIVCAPKISVKQVGYLRQLIRSYLNSIKELSQYFPKGLFPKQHFLSHYPELILIFGPLIWLFTLRFESKHVFFKKVVRASKNYINITKTLAQKYMCRFAYDHATGLFPPDVVYDPSSTSALNLNNLPQSVTAVLPNGFNPASFEVLDWVVLKGTEYRRGSYIVLGEKEESVSLEVGCILYILLDNKNSVSFVLKLKEAVNSWNGYYVLKTDAQEGCKMVPHEDLLDFYPLPSYEFLGEECISLKHFVFL